MDTNGRAAASFMMWVTYLGLVFMTIDRLEGWSILMAFVLMIPLMGAMAFMWTTQQGQSAAKSNPTLSLDEIEKRKRDRVDSVLRKLSNDELVQLRQRLSDGELDDDNLYEYMVGDDGELVRKG